VKTERDIHHVDGKFFQVIACEVEAQNREVPSWTQPLLKPREPGIIGMLIRKINGIYHFLIQAKVEPGNFDILEMAPTAQAITGSYKEVDPEHRPPFLDTILNAEEGQIRFSTLQSEEGGRFFREENRNIIVEVGDDFPLEVPDNYIWMTMSQIKDFIRYNNYVNVQCRTLLACLGLL
jgi:oxidase EvaA